MVDFSQLDPSRLKPGLTDGNGNLKPSLVTSSYAGGVPASASDLKPSLVYPDGRLREGLIESDHDDLKLSLLGDHVVRSISKRQAILMGHFSDIREDGKTLRDWSGWGESRDSRDASLIESPCGSFDGSSTIVDGGSLVTTKNDRTIFAWMRTTGTSEYILAERDNSGGGLSMFINNTGRLIPLIGTQTKTTSAVVNDGDWHFLTLTYEESSGDVRHYVDGVEVLHDTSGSGVFTPGKPVCLGNRWTVYPSVGGFYFSGDLCSVGIFQRVLSDDEINLLMRNQEISQVDAVRNWAFSENAGLNIYDKVSGSLSPVTTPSEASFWSATQNEFHENIVRGFSLLENGGQKIYLPFDNFGSPLNVTPPSGYTKTADYFPGGFLPCSTKIDFTPDPLAPWSIGLGLERDYAFDDGRTPPHFVTQSSLKEWQFFTSS